MIDKNKAHQADKSPSQTQSEGEKDDKFKPTFPIPTDPEVADPQAVTKEQKAPASPRDQF